MRTISTGEPATLETYRKIALALSGSEESKAVKFFDEKIANAINGKNAEVIAYETQMMYLIMSMISRE